MRVESGGNCPPVRPPAAASRASEDCPGKFGRRWKQVFGLRTSGTGGRDCRLRAAGRRVSRGGEACREEAAGHSHLAHRGRAWSLRMARLGVSTLRNDHWRRGRGRSLPFCLSSEMESVSARRSPADPTGRRMALPALALCHPLSQRKVSGRRVFGFPSLVMSGGLLAFRFREET